MIETIQYEGCANDALAAAERSSAEFVWICEASLAGSLVPPEEDELAAVDVIHSGLRFGADDNLRRLQIASLSWFFLDAPADVASVSWKATPECVLLRPESLRTVGGFDLEFSTARGRLVDVCYRILAAGGRTRYSPDLLAAPSHGRNEALPLADELYFTAKHLGAQSCLYSALWSRRCGLAPPARTHSDVSAAVAAARANATAVGETAHLSLRLGPRKQTVGSVTAIIPTLYRHKWIPGALDSLFEQTRPPDEIIVVDQTAPADRPSGLYEPYIERGVKVIYLDRAGQSIARNRALREATGDWIFFFEDDAVAWPDLIERHIDAVEHTGSAASTGQSIAPWKTVEHIPVRIRHEQLATVFATGNALAKRSVVEEVGLLDEAFDRGPGADHDLGVRLHLAGHETVSSPAAVMTHYKAPMGGLRKHGVWWRTSSSIKAPFPPPTQVYTIQRYYPRKFWPALYLLYFAHARNHHSPWKLALLYATSPWKLWRALRDSDTLAQAA